MPYQNYDPSKLSVVFGGIPIRGFAEGTMFEIELEESRYSEMSDVHGSISRSKINKNTASITLHLLQNSPSNQTLASFLEADRINDNGVFPVIIKDDKGNTIFACAAAYIKGVPKVSYGSEVGAREWVIRASNVSVFV